MRIIFYIMMTIMVPVVATGQSFTEKITKEYAFEKRSADNAVIVSNINGHVNVIGYDGEKILVEVVKNIRGKTEARLEKGKQEVTLGVIDRADTLIFYIADGCNSFGEISKEKHGHNGWNRNGWGYVWNCNDGKCRHEYDYTMDFTIRVPADRKSVV